MSKKKEFKIFFFQIFAESFYSRRVKREKRKEKREKRNEKNEEIRKEKIEEFY